MTEAVLSVDSDAGASEVLRYFAGYPIHHLPVVEGSRVVGMLSTADVMKLEHIMPRSGGDAREYLDQRMKVASLVRGPAITIRRSQNITEAAGLLARHAIHALAVVDESGGLVGIVTTTDIISAMLSGADATQSASPEVLHLQRRLRDLEEVLRIAERFLVAGQDEQLHAQLARAIAQIRNPSAATA